MSDVSHEQQPFGDLGFADNPENRCPVVLLLDNSGSMGGAPIQQLNGGLQVFRDELFADSLAAKRVEVAIVSFGPVNVATDFTTVQNFFVPTLSVAGDTLWARQLKRVLACWQTARPSTKKIRLAITALGYF